MTVAQNYIGTQTQSTPTEDRCRHGQPYDACCNRPEVDDAYGDSFGTTDDLRGIQ
jgi:hypothetical protein